VGVGMDQLQAADFCRLLFPHGAADVAAIPQADEASLIDQMPDTPGVEPLGMKLVGSPEVSRGRQLRQRC
jgi:hypothetical protein